MLHKYPWCLNELIGQILCNAKYLLFPGFKFCKLAGMKIKVHPALTEYFTYCLYKAAMKLKADLDKALQKSGITSQQMGILALLDKTGDISQITLSDSMNIDQASMVRFLNGLLKKGLIHKKSQISDGRVKLISMTRQGHRIFKKVKVLSASTENVFLKNLSLSEQKLAKQLVAKMIL